MSESEDLGLAFSELSLQNHAPFVAKTGRKQWTAPYPFAGDRYWLDPIPATSPSPTERQRKKKNKAKSHGLPEESQMTDSRLLLLAQLLGQPHEKIDLEASWNALGMDSLLLTQWALKLNREYSYDVNLKRLQSDLPSMAALYKAFPLGKVEAIVERNLDEGIEEDEYTRKDPEDLKAMQRIMLDQIQLMNRQLDLMQRILGDAPLAKISNEPLRGSSSIAAKRTRVFEFHTDQGPKRIEADERAFLGLDEEGQVALFIEDSEETGSYRQIKD
jgi:acyl carrier protein